MRFLIISALLSFSVVSDGCRNDNALKAVNANQTATGSPKISNAQINSSGMSSDVKIGQGIGLITKINLELGSVELKHNEIKGMMPGMIMEFYVTEKKELEALKIGDKAAFTLEDNKGVEKIIKISKIE